MKNRNRLEVEKVVRSASRISEVRHVNSRVFLGLFFCSFPILASKETGISQVLSIIRGALMGSVDSILLVVVFFKVSKDVKKRSEN